MHTLVIGGGFAGVKAAIEISRRQLGRVTLLAETPYLLDRAATRTTLAGRSAADTLLALDDILAIHPEIQFIQDTLTSLDPDRNLAIGSHESYLYDTLVLALEQEESSPTARHADPYGVKALEKIHNHLYDALAYDRHVNRDYVVVGAGETGVAMAGLLSHYVKKLSEHHLVKKAKVNITLAESKSHILPALSKQASQQAARQLHRLDVTTVTNQTVALKDSDLVTVGSKKIPLANVIWATGQRSNRFFAQHPQYFDTTSSGYVKVNPYLEAYRDIYVIGDNIDSSAHPSVRSALDMGVYIADHIARKQASETLSAYKPISSSTNVAIGTDWAYVEMLGVYISGGLTARVSRRLSYAEYRQIMPKAMAETALPARSPQPNST